MINPRIHCLLFNSLRRRRIFQKTSQLFLMSDFLHLIYSVSHQTTSFNWNKNRLSCKCPKWLWSYSLSEARFLITKTDGLGKLKLNTVSEGIGCDLLVVCVFLPHRDSFGQGRVYLVRVSFSVPNLKQNIINSIFNKFMLLCFFSPFECWNASPNLPLNELPATPERNCFFSVKVYHSAHIPCLCEVIFFEHTLHWSHQYRMSLYLKLATPVHPSSLWSKVWSLSILFF